MRIKHTSKRLEGHIVMITAIYAENTGSVIMGRGVRGEDLGAVLILDQHPIDVTKAHNVYALLENAVAI